MEQKFNSLFHTVKKKSVKEIYDELGVEKQTVLDWKKLIML